MKRSTKRYLRQGGLYAVLAVVVIFLAVSVDWATIRTVFWTPGLGDNWHDLILTGVKNTAIYTVIAFVLGLALALVLALMKISDVVVYRWLATAYIELFRGLPALITILFMAFAVPIAFHGWHPPGGTAGAGVIGLVMVAGAYMAETLRAGLQAVPKGQTEAARSLGMSPSRTMVHVVIPQAFRIIIPPLTNEFVLLLKDTSLVSIAGVALGQSELTNFGSENLNIHSSPTPLIVVAVCYLIITLPLTQLVAYLERRTQKAR